MAEPGAVQVAAACDEAYAMPLAVMLASLGRSLGAGRSAEVHVLERGLSTATKAAVERSVRRHPLAISWLAVAPERLAWLGRTLGSLDHLSLDAYSRLLLPELLPPALARVIYLDCDLVIRRDLGELWDLDVAGRYALAAPELDPQARLVSSPRGLRLYRELGLPPDLETCNSGVLLLNLSLWRSELLAQRIFHYFCQAADQVRWHDQDGLNAVMAGRWGRLDPRWNVTMHVFRRDIDPALRARLLHEPFIVHFNTALKPWQPGFHLGFGELFLEHLDTTAWAGWRPAQPAHPRLYRWSRMGRRALRKRAVALRKTAQAGRERLAVLAAVRRPLPRLDRRELRSGHGEEIRLFVIAERADPGLAPLLAHYLASGVDRALVAIGETRRDEVEDLLRVDERVHLFALDPARRSRDQALRHLLRRHGGGHWCVAVGADELLLYPDAGRLSLRSLCARLDALGCEAMACRVVDAPEAGPVTLATTGCRRIATVLRDPVEARFFAASLLVRAGAAPEDVDACRSKVPLLRYRPGMLIAGDLQAVHGVCQAACEGTLLRLRDPPGAAEGLAWARGLRPAGCA